MKDPAPNQIISPEQAGEANGHWPARISVNWGVGVAQQFQCAGVYKLVDHPDEHGNPMWSKEDDRAIKFHSPSGIWWIGTSQLLLVRANPCHHGGFFHSSGIQLRDHAGVAQWPGIERVY